MISFSLAEGSPGKLAVRLEADLLGGRRSPRQLRLLARRGDRITAHSPAFSHTERVAGPRFIRRKQILRWELCFEIPALVAKDPSTTFQLICKPHGAVDLPELGWSVKPPIYERRTPRAGALLAASAALLAGLGPGLALADGGASSTPGATQPAQTATEPAQTVTEPAQTTTSTPPPITTTDPAPATTATTTATPPPTTTSPPPPPATTTSTAPVTTTTTSTATTTTATTTTTTTTATTPTTTSTTTTSTATTPTTTTPSLPTTSTGSGATTRRHRSSHKQSAGSTGTTSHAVAPVFRVTQKKSTPAPAPAPVSSTDPDHDGDDDAAEETNPVVSSGSEWTIPSLADPFTSAQLRTYATLVGGLAQPPKYLVKIYQAAAAHYHLPWQILAAINYVETGYGRDLAVSSAGALGWMQFMPSTWAQYGQAVNLQGQPIAATASPWNPTDAIFAAAHYLTVAGAQQNLPKAVYAYNHAGWYVQEVLSIAEQITSHDLQPGAKAGHKIEAMRTMARLLNGLPYVWGGGHSAFSLVSGGYDCSGFVSAVLHAAGYLQIPQTTQTLPGEPGIQSGPGHFVTILDRTDAGISDDHVIIDIDGQWWESGGWGVQSDRVHRMQNVTASYLQSFNVVLHPQGL